MIERLLQDSWTASGNKLDNPDIVSLKRLLYAALYSFCCFLDSLCKPLHCKTKYNKTTAIPFWISSASLWTHGYWSGPGKDQTRWTSRPLVKRPILLIKPSQSIIQMKPQSPFFSKSETHPTTHSSCNLREWRPFFEVLMGENETVNACACGCQCAPYQGQTLPGNQGWDEHSERER